MSAPRSGRKVGWLCLKSFRQTLQDPAMAEQFAQSLNEPAETLPHQRLSDREFEVFKAIATGMTVGEIARRLILSVKTISGYRANILQKTGLKNNAAIMKYALDHQLVE